MAAMLRRSCVPLAALLAAACGADPVAGPDPGSEPPTAVAGGDRSVIDQNGDGWEYVSLDPSASEPGSRPLSSYRWLEDGTELARGSFYPKDHEYGLPDWWRPVQMDVGRHSIQLMVYDAAAVSDSDRVVVDVLPRELSTQIVSPSDGAVFATGAEVWLFGRGVDRYGEPLHDEQLSWSSDLDGPLGTGEMLRVETLSRGAHVVTLSGTEDGGLAGTASVAIKIADPPTVTILSPPDGGFCTVFDDLRLEGACVDQDGTAVTGRGSFWEPDMWTGSETRYDMTVYAPCTWPGEERISLVCTDANGLTSRAQVTVDILPSYSFHIQAVLADFGCTDCHGASRQEGDIRLDTYLDLTTGENGNGPLLVPGDATRGILIPKILSGHQTPDPQSLTTPFYWGWVSPDIGVVNWWVDLFLAPWIDGGARND